MTSHDQRPISHLAYPWPAVPYDEWSATGDTLHMHTQVLGKLAVARAPQQWQLGHAALRLTARGWETALLPAPDRSGAFVAALDLHTHEAVVEHSDGRARRVPLTPNRSVGAVTRDVLQAVESLVGAGKDQHAATGGAVGHPAGRRRQTQHVRLRPRSGLPRRRQQRCPGPGRPARTFPGPRQLRSTRGGVRSTWPCTSSTAGRPTRLAHDFIKRNSDNAEQIVVGWWPGDARYRRAAFYGYALPAPGNFAKGKLAPPSARWEATLGEYILDWHDVIASPDPFGAAYEFGRSVIAYACTVCDWDPALANSAQGIPPPVQ